MEYIRKNKKKVTLETYDPNLFDSTIDPQLGVYRDLRPDNLFLLEICKVKCPTFMLLN